METDLCMYVLFYLCIRCASAPCLSTGDGMDNEIKTDNYNAEKKTFTFNNRKRKKITSEMSLFAFFVQAWHCDTVELMIITTAYEVSAY